MKKYLLIAFIIPATWLPSFDSGAQEVPSTTEQQLEDLADADQTEPEDDSYLQQLAQFKKHPLDLNDADAGDLKEFFFLTALQINNFISYRDFLGRLISVYELQAIPCWDVATIKKLLPYITIGNALTAKEEIRARLKKGEHNILLRVSEVLETAVGFDHSTAGTKYLGGKQRIFLRYRYQYKNLLQWGVVADKDAGEQFFKGSQKYGFDFYSVHLFIRNLGSIRAIALGDFTVNLGQGLIQWQSLAFRKGGDVMNIKRQSAALRPYNSAGEFNFFRGAGITVRKKNFEATAFVSAKKISANLVTDTMTHRNFVSSLTTSGYHRTQSELDDRNNLRQVAFGGHLNLQKNTWHIGVNAVSFYFSSPLAKADEPYKKYAISGNRWVNLSLDYSLGFRNLHFFGEAAIDKNCHRAAVNGLLISVDPRIDLSILHRSISQDYRSLYGNAFTENTDPENETGLYLAITARPASGWRLDMYADFYKFPWLKYLTDGPASGKDFLVQLSYMPNKELECSSRFRCETKQSNQPGNFNTTNFLVAIPKQNWRTEISYRLNKEIAVRSRIELVWWNSKSENQQRGFLDFVDVFYKPLLKRYAAGLRLQYFETDSYDSRIYAYENDVLYGYSIPAFYDKGFRNYFNFNFDIRQNLSLWFRWAQTFFQDKEMSGSSMDEIIGNKKSEIKLQVICSF